MFVMHPPRTVSEAIRLSQSGLSDYEVARRLGIPRSTVQNWRLSGPPQRRRPTRILLTRPLDDRAYSYVLGMYLGDGWLSHHGQTTTGLSFKLDARYPAIVEECVSAVAACLPVRVGTGRSPGVIRIWAYAPDWPNLFPQHGRGRKHQRKIELVPWQRAITYRYVREFIRGLIHSDGSRCINRFSVKLPSGRVGRYEYPRYFFTNYSADIRRIFCDHCKLLGIRWTQSNPRNISVSHRDSVALLDEFVGPKS
jgi:hypothetical protein